MKSLKNPDDFQCPVFVRQSVIDEMKRHGRSSMNKEVCGILLGNLSLDEEENWRVCVDARIEGKYADNQSGAVTFTGETWDWIHEQMAEKYPGMRIVGWYHTHPSFGIFLSDMDLYIHRNFFPLRWQCAYVYDPQAEEDGWFLWQDDSPKKGEVLIFQDSASLRDETDFAATSPLFSPSSEESQDLQTPTPQETMKTSDYILLAACSLIMLLMCTILFQTGKKLQLIEKQLSELEIRTEKTLELPNEWKHFKHGLLQNFQMLGNSFTEISQLNAEESKEKEQETAKPEQIHQQESSPKTRIGHFHERPHPNSASQPQNAHSEPKQDTSAAVSVPVQEKVQITNQTQLQRPEYHPIVPQDQPQDQPQNQSLDRSPRQTEQGSANQTDPSSAKFQHNPPPPETAPIAAPVSQSKLKEPVHE